MVIDVLYVKGVTVSKPENDPPVRADRHAPIALQCAFQGMKPKSGQVHIRDGAGGVETGEDVVKFREMFAPLGSLLSKTSFSPRCRIDRINQQRNA